MQEFLSNYAQTIDKASEQLLAISEMESRIPRLDGKWSPKQVIGHLIDSASNNHQRFVRAQFTDDLVFSGYEQEAWVRVQRYDEEPWEQLVQLWKYYNLHLLHFMNFMTEENLKKPRAKHTVQQIGWQAVSEAEPVRLEAFIEDYVHHLKHHLRQILPSW